jgi:hypothetical protein
VDVFGGRRLSREASISRLACSAPVALRYQSFFCTSVAICSFCFGLYMLGTLCESDHSPKLSLADQKDHLSWRSRIGIDFDDNMRYGILSLLLMDSSASFPSGLVHGIYLLLLSPSWGFYVVPAYTAVPLGFSVHKHFNLCCVIPNFSHRTISDSHTTKCYIFPSHRHAYIRSKISARALCLLRYPEL